MKWPKAIVLKPNPKHDDDDWHFTIPLQFVDQGLRQTRMLKIILSGAAITLDTEKMSSNRILNADDATKFILLMVDRSFRFPDHPPKIATEYLNRMFKAGVFLNKVQYRFYHHSNSQLRGRSCFLREANTDKELDDRIYDMGDFGRIANVAKRAKRIGLLFSSAEIDFQLDPELVEDIPDIEVGNEVFSDGCGLISQSLAIKIAKAKKILFRGMRYTPTVIQIRYLGYKGVLMQHPDLDTRNSTREQGTKACLAQFRKSMKKFKSTADHSFSVVGYSKPYTFGRLNNDIITLISSLGVSTEKLIAKQQAYFDWIIDAIKIDTDLEASLDFLSCLDKYDKAEKVFLREGVSDEGILKDIRAMQLEELSKHHDKQTNKFKTRMIIHKSRRLFGVCDPYGVLKEGQVHIRITVGRKGPATPIHGDVLIVRNPCLHPGDCLKLRAVDHPQLGHLVDCVVFATTVRKPGNKPAPSMSSGGDLDGDEFFVCWDPDLVPPHVSESYDYPPNKEPRPKNVTREDLANHFASYNSSGVARVSALHNKWAISSPKGALCVECQELNVLHSQSVDGAPIKIPDRLKNPPEPEEPFIIDLLQKHEEEFETTFRASPAVNPGDLVYLDAEHAERHIVQLFKSNQNALSEYQLFELALRLSRKHKFDVKPFLSLLDLSALSAMQKHTISTTLHMEKVDHPYLWNSLFQSDILSTHDLRLRGLDSSISLQKLYTSSVHSQVTFFEYLRRATQDYTRKLLLLRTDDRFAIGIFMRGQIAWDELTDSEVDENVVVVSFMARSSSTPPTRKPCDRGYRLHCSYGRFQLYDRNIGNTFVFIGKAPSGHESEVITSIALQKLSKTLGMQLGRLYRQSLIGVELHVVSNHDRIAQQLFDLWYDHVPTEEYIPRFVRKAVPYHANDLKYVDWIPPGPSQDEFESEADLIAARRQWLERTQELDLIKGVVYPYLQDMQLPPKKSRRHHSEDTIRGALVNASRTQLDAVMKFTIDYHTEEDTFLVFQYTVGREPLDDEFVEIWIERYPPLVFSLLRKFPPSEELDLAEELDGLEFAVLRAIVRSANDTRIAALVALEKLASTVRKIHLKQYMDLLMLVALCTRAPTLYQELLLVLNESRLNMDPQPLTPAEDYARRHTLNIVFDRAEEAAAECPCNDEGNPRKQKTAPAQTTLSFADSERTIVTAYIRLDAKTNVRLHSHVRLKAISKAENRWLVLPVLDGLVTLSQRGELKIALKQPAPPELEKMDWVIYDAGSIATAQAMFDAVFNLVSQRELCCTLYRLIVGDQDHGDDESQQSATPLPTVDKGKGKEWARSPGLEEPRGGPSTTEGDGAGEEEEEFDAEGFDFSVPFEAVLPDSTGLNASQMQAIGSWTAPLSLIWGPPGTGKTTVVVQILRSILLSFSRKVPIVLVTASTHNAVDNVLERFIRINDVEKLIPEEQILRVATDQSRVGDNLLPYTLDARVGGDLNQNRQKMKKAVQRLKRARMVFTTCAGAGLGVLRKFQADMAIIDEASQITEPCALIPLVKGIQKALLVGDHVQLRPTVQNMGKVLGSDVSLLERLYSGEDLLGMTKTMLDVQYRSPRVLNAFPSKEFYDDKLKTADQNESKLSSLETLSFPWPRDGDTIVPTIFVPCSVEEDIGGRSKSNEGQVELVHHIISLLGSKPDVESTSPLEITVLSPYRGQNNKLKYKLPSSIPVSTVDGFQGRESDIVIFSTVRCNADCEIGFLDDPRRLNVMWTRARLALIIVGDKRTLLENGLWKRAVEACKEVCLSLPTSGSE
ncbi:RNA-directed RNA polymerase [Coprinopsis marcescibilis]|uniref:RNA-directed RNA polymerase n=1 Tax=Coprinopsis marcescibilis TaxID=230819 RepID=A0A5C3KTX7_COPMA|nr:RNA-directed RNA polymerase [Coprinopsis marcescibilis]